MKIAFIGTSCVGKTMLLEHYRATFKDDPRVACVTEAARTFFSQHRVADRFSAETQGHIQQLALRQEQEVHARGARLIFCDRSVLDAVVYVRAAGDHQGAGHLFERVHTWTATYAHLLLLDPVGIDYVTDGIRQEDRTLRQRFHNAFLQFFQETALPYELLSGSFPERCHRIDDLLNGFWAEENRELASGEQRIENIR